MRIVHRRRYGDDDEICITERRRIGAHGQSRRRLEVLRGDLARRIDMTLIIRHLFLRPVEADGAQLLAELDGKRQPDIAQTHNSNRSHCFPSRDTNSVCLLRGLDPMQGVDRVHDPLAAPGSRPFARRNPIVSMIARLLATNPLDVPHAHSKIEPDARTVPPAPYPRRRSPANGSSRLGHACLWAARIKMGSGQSDGRQRRKDERR